MFGPERPIEAMYTSMVDADANAYTYMYRKPADPAKSCTLSSKTGIISFFVAVDFEEEEGEAELESEVVPLGVGLGVTVAAAVYANVSSMHPFGLMGKMSLVGSLMLDGM